MGKYTKKSPKKKKGNLGCIFFLAITMILLAAVVAGAVWVLMHYHIVSGKFYPKDAAVLDLREEEIKPRYFDKLSEKMPETEIRWNIPFQGGTLADDATEIIVTDLSEEDVELLDYAWQL